MTKYESIANEMRRRIKEGYYPIDQPIPDELSLAEEFGSSRMTMRKALDLLVSEGLLFRKRGHGTFIIQMYKNQSLNVISDESLGLSNLVKGKPVSSEIIQFTIEFPSEEVAGHLAIGKQEPVYHIIRLRMVDHEPYVMEETYMPSNLIPGITEDILHASIYNYIQQDLELKIGGAHRTIMADKSNELDQTYLECKKEDPILQVVQVGFLNNGVPFEYSFSRHRYDKFVFTSVSVRNK